MKMSEVTTVSKLKEYLNERLRSRRWLYHYTSLETLLIILKTKKILMNNIKNCNDNEEFTFFKNDDDPQMFVTSFTYEAQESIHYWAVYGKGSLYSIRIGFPADVFQDPYELKYIINEDNEPTSCKDSSDEAVIAELEDDEFPAYDYLAELGEVIYFDPVSSLWKHNTRSFSMLRGDCIETSIREKFLAFCKYSIWEHEKETRLLLSSNYFNDDRIKNKIFFALPDDVVKYMEVTFSPWLNDLAKEEIAKMLIQVVKESYNIDISPSQFKRSAIHNQVKPM